MKVLMLGRIDLFQNRGGDTVQIENTAEELRNLGVEVDICSDLSVDMQGYDLIHIFQLDWIPEIYFYFLKAEKYNKKIVFSPIHHNINEVKRFDDEYVFDYRRISKILFKNQFSRDTFKNVYRSIRDIKRIGPTIYSVIYGFKNMQKRMLEWSDHILVQTNREAEDLKNTFEVDFRWTKISNGVGKIYYENKDYEPKLKLKDYVICVGRIEPRKNQLKIIEAVTEIREQSKEDINLVFLGSYKGAKHLEYTYLFNEALKKNKWITHIDRVPYKDMPSYYKYAKVCCSASWFETTGLTVLEALFCGTNAVASGDRARECLGDYASYCDPGDKKSIRIAIEKELKAPRPLLSDDMRREYTWENAARKTLEIYNCILDEK
ncbi:MAG TPA: glycosyltransferase [bacterium]|nr:glycosyltransferase [bacterium]